ncbi:MAG: S1 RNA-binding domain-containing protein [Planctomycetaceae bacterium]|jgi:small subunit ribosomal protein S1|nr:S1 RNA-binding domain-containing protein [Planctomycetaceae bacterium]
MTSETNQNENISADSETPAPVPVKPKRLIGSQRNPGEYVPKPAIPVVRETVNAEGESVRHIIKPHTETYPPENTPLPPKNKDVDADDLRPDHLSKDGEKHLTDVPPPPVQRVDVPKYRGGKMSADLEAEFNAVFGSSEQIETLIKQSEATGNAVLEPDTQIKAVVLSIQQDNVFLNVGTKEQGVVSLKLFPPDKEPKAGEEIEVTVVRFLQDEGLYEATVPLAALDVRDWSQVREGMVVEAKITKTNTGGLECQVNNLRGFIPISQIDMFRVENTEAYVGQKLTCLVEEVNIERRNLVLSRKSLLIREREEQRTKLLSELETGQIREGLVRKLIDAGAFVDLGGVDGFIPIGAMAWGRVRHPSDLLSEGMRIKVRISKIDETNNRITLIYRDESSNPWLNILERFQERTLARGKVSRIADFGAFIELMPGVEGLVHISELSNKRVNRVNEAVREGDWVDVFIVSIDLDRRRIALSMKQANEKSDENVPSAEGDAAEPSREPLKIKNEHKGPLKGGTGSTAGGAFGLKW